MEWALDHYGAQKLLDAKVIIGLKNAFVCWI
jgi:hypothetical protein